MSESVEGAGWRGARAVSPPRSATNRGSGAVDWRHAVSTVTARMPSSLSAIAARLPRRLSPLSGVAGAVFLIVTWVWSAAGIRLYLAYRQGLDLLIFSQAAEAMSHGRLPYSSAKGAHYMLFADHFHPVILLLGPLYRIWPDPRVLLITQAVCIGLAAAIAATCAAERATHRVEGGLPWPFSAAIAGLALAVAPGIQTGGLFAFHEVAFGLPLLAMACRAFVRRDRLGLFGWALPLCLVKEDAGFIVAGLGLAAVCVAWRRLGVVLLAIGALWTVVCVKVIIPALRGGSWDYDGMVPASPATMLANVGHNLFAPSQFGWVVLLLIVCCGATAFASPLVLAVLPNVLSRAITDNPAYLSNSAHYNMLICVVLVFAALDAGAHRRWLGPARNALFLALGAGLALGNGQLINTFAAPLDHREIEAADCVVAAVPRGAGVAMDWRIAPHMVVGHDPVHELLADSQTDRATPELPVPSLPGISWAVVDVTAGSKEDSHWGENYVRLAADHGWHETKRCGKFAVLHRA